MKVDLLEFMRTGAFGDLRLGMNSNQVLKFIGPPEDYSTAPASPQIWKVGSVELMFENDVLMSIEQKVTESGSWPTLEISPASLAQSQALTERELVEHSRTLGVTVVELRRPSYLGATTIALLENDVRLVFEQDHLMTLSVLAPPSSGKAQ
jgi:hypothetical protein